MSLQEAAKELNRLCKTESEKDLLQRIDELEKIIINLTERLSYLEDATNRIYYN